MPGSTPATSQLDWLSSTTAMIVLSWSKATRDLLKSFSWGIGALRQLFASDDGAISSPPAPYHLSAGGRWIRTFGSWSRDRQTDRGRRDYFLENGSGSVDCGRDTHYWAPPAQNRTGSFPAYGSHLGCLTAGLGLSYALRRR